MKKIICLFAILVCAGSKKLPSYITPCQRNSDLHSCILSNLEAARPYLSKGVPRLGIPPLNPLKIPSIGMSLPNFSVFCKNLTYHGIDQVQFKDLQIDVDQGIFNAKLFYPLLKGECDYTMKGNFLKWTFDGFSYGTGMLKNMLISVKLKGEEKIINGKVHLEFKKVGFELVSLDGGSLYFENLIRDNPEMTKQANEFLNRPEVFNVFVSFLGPVVDAIFGNVFSEAVKNVFLMFPLGELFPK